MKKKLSELHGKWIDNNESFMTIMSGKDYLIPILLIKTQMFKKSGAKPSLEKVKINLIQNFDINKLNKLKQMIES